MDDIVSPPPAGGVLPPAIAGAPRSYDGQGGRATSGDGRLRAWS